MNKLTPSKVTLSYKEFENLQHFMLDYAIVEVEITEKDNELFAKDVHTGIEKNIADYDNGC